MQCSWLSLSKVWVGRADSHVDHTFLMLVWLQTQPTSIPQVNMPAAHVTAERRENEKAIRTACMSPTSCRLAELDVRIAPSLLDSVTTLQYPRADASWTSYIIIAGEEVRMLPMSWRNKSLASLEGCRYGGAAGLNARRHGPFPLLF